jgi:hypothetical protein
VQGRKGRLTDRLTYANAMATMALFISLGGASYAAVSLPANSVGPKQLRAGAVTPRSLGFPLGAQSIEYSESIAARPNPCTKPPPPIHACKAPELARGTKVGSIKLHQAGRVAVTALATLRNGSASKASSEELALVYLFSDGHRLQRVRIAVPGGGRPVLVPMQALFTAPPGISSIEVGAELDLGTADHGAAGIAVEGVSVIATELPTN